MAKNLLFHFSSHVPNADFGWVIECFSSFIPLGKGLLKLNQSDCNVILSIECNSAWDGQGNRTTWFPPLKKGEACVLNSIFKPKVNFCKSDLLISCFPWWLAA
ncbi:hypothetical protein D4S03_12345 [bacterium]|nr:MAG: hypothetical protein D4S03_12345 [bacterium]